MGDKTEPDKLILDGSLLLEDPPRPSNFQLAPNADALIKIVEGFAEKYDKIVEGFAEKYDGVVRAVRDRAPRIVLARSTSRRSSGRTRRVARVLLTPLNDRILRTAYRWGLDGLDLRAICTSGGDFTLQVGPSAAATAKMTRALTAIAAGTEGRRITGIAG